MFQPRGRLDAATNLLGTMFTPDSAAAYDKVHATATRDETIWGKNDCLTTAIESMT